MCDGLILRSSEPELVQLLRVPADAPADREAVQGAGSAGPAADPAAGARRRRQTGV